MNNERPEEYLEFLVREEPWTLPFRAYAKEHDVPIIRRTAQNLLELIIGMEKPVDVLEIGTAIGFSSIVMYRQMEKYTVPHIDTIENWPPRIVEAKKNLSPYDGKIRLLEGDAAEVIRTLEGPYDLIFLDGPKGQYEAYLPYLLELLRVDGILLIDNVLQDNEVTLSRFAVERRDRTIHKRMRDFLYDISHHPQLQTAIMPIADGVAICRKRETENGTERNNEQK